MATKTVNNAEFYYEIHGQGHPLILIAGYTCDHTFWYPILNKLSQHFQVVIFDNRGTGQTLDNNELLSVELMGDDVIHLAQALELKKPYIAGQSMGGTIVQSIASRYGNLISKLAIMTSTAKWRKAMLLALQSHIELREQGVDFNTLFNNMIPWLLGESFLHDEKKVRDLKQKMLKAPFPQSLENQKRQYRVLEKFNGLDKLQFIHSPALICYGREDLLALPYESQLLSSKISNSQLVEFEHAAHGVVLENSDLLSDTLIKFFNA